MRDFDVARKMVSVYNNAESRDLEYTMTFAKTKRLMSQKKCAFTKVLFEKDGDNKRSFDRLDNSIGYTNDNVVACTIRINRLKSNLSVEEIEGIHRLTSKISK